MLGPCQIPEGSQIESSLSSWKALCTSGCRACLSPDAPQRSKYEPEGGARRTCRTCTQWSTAGWEGVACAPSQIAKTRSAPCRPSPSGSPWRTKSVCCPSRRHRKWDIYWAPRTRLRGGRNIALPHRPPSDSLRLFPEPLVGTPVLYTPIKVGHTGGCFYLVSIESV